MEPMMPPQMEPPVDPQMDQMDQGMDTGMDQALPGPQPPQPARYFPNDPISAVLSIPGDEAVRRVYSLALTAARSKNRLNTMMDRMDARQYHNELASSPEARYAVDLIAVRRKLDALAAERRRLNVEAVRARESGRPASIYELQSTAATNAMEQIALGTLLFLTVPYSMIEMHATRQIEQQEPEQQEQSVS